ncbi:MAG: PilZ domain-containing protein, partial [Deltaproteobacteria bacterium]|nr:PilZ domain-containing protein [Deltaproteobacteria bacterium]
MLQDARQAARRMVTSLATLYDGFETIELPICDLSRDGLFLGSDLLLEEGERYFLSFVLPGTADLVRGQGEI